MLESQSRALKTRRIAKFLKYLGQNVGPFDGRQGPGKTGHKNAKIPPLGTSPQENPKPKTENFFWLEHRTVAESVEGLNTSLAAAASELWPKEASHYPGSRGR